MFFNQFQKLSIFASVFVCYQYMYKRTYKVTAGATTYILIQYIDYINLDLYYRHAVHNMVFSHEELSFLM